jgi:hypothetical protein
MVTIHVAVAPTVAGGIFLSDSAPVTTPGLIWTEVSHGLLL